MAKIAKVQEVDVVRLKPYERNAKIHGADQIEKLCKSIEEFGFISPCLIDNEYNVIAGHGRIMAAQEMGLKKVPCLFVDGLTDEQRRAYILADNRLTELGEWDMALVETELSELQLEDFDISVTGFDLDIGEIEPESIVEDDVPEPPKEAKSKLGQVYQLGNHRLMCGDSTNQVMVADLMDGNIADLLLTDPPYNVNYEGGTEEHLTIENDSMEDGEFYNLLCNAFSMANQVMRPGAAFYIWHADSEGFNFRSACIATGWKVRQCLIWNKNSLVMGRQDYQWKHEPCLYGWKEGAGHTWNSDRKQTTVIDYERPNRNSIHPTMKPVGLFDYLIKNSTKKGDLVLDLFGGSGTSIMACEQNERKCFMMELDPRYVDAIIERWESFTGKKAVLLRDA